MNSEINDKNEDLGTDLKNTGDDFIECKFNYNNGSPDARSNAFSKPGSFIGSPDVRSNVQPGSFISQQRDAYDT
jgi:hypothetical protein